MSNVMNDLHQIGLNPFAVTLLAESMLKSDYVKHCGVKPLTFAFPVNRSDCAGWQGVRLTIEAVPVEAAGQEGATPFRPGAVQVMTESAPCVGCSKPLAGAEVK